MDTSTITIYADYQKLTVRSGVMRYASDTVNYVRADFEFGKGWEGFDAIQAVWKSRYDTISVVLDEEGCCMVPQEVLARRSKVQVNLVGFTVDEESMTARLTSYPVLALDVDVKAEIYGNETADITPNQFEQFVGIVADNASSARTSALSANESASHANESATEANADATRAETARTFLENASAEATTLAPGSQATASYDDGVFSFGIPQGLQGERGDAGEIDTAMSGSSALPVQNKVIKAYVDGGLSTKADVSSLPTKVSDLTNDSGYITSSALPTKVSDLTNDSGFITASAIPTNVSAFTNDCGYLTSYSETGVIEFDTSASAGTIDGDLYALLTDWGWTDCIV